MAANFLRTVRFLTPALFALVVSSGASAQSMTLPAVLYRTTALRPTRQKPYWVSYADCVNDDELWFKAVAFTGAFQTFPLQIWAGSTDCTDQQARTGTAPTCWLVFEGSISYNVSDVKIKSRDIAAKHLNTSAIKGPGSGTRADCDTGVDPPLQLTLFFMFELNDQIQGTPATWTQTGLDITRPNPPLNLTASPGETRIHMDWTPIVTDTDVAEYWLFCVPTGTTSAALSTYGADAAGTVRQLLEAGLGGTTSWVDGAVIDGGGLGTGGTGGTTSTETSCMTSGPLTTDQVTDPNFVSTYKCGNVSGRATSTGTASGLTNGTEYAVAVAAVDQVANIGKLSANQCATPVEVTDFFELYRAAGGKGGGGFCSFGPFRRGPVVPLSIAALVIGAGVLRRRRK